jgi:acyl transferase domain-containing protein/NAD(P)H-dependent flavin oxidoreductase YrpB (nitropropane dioxygenase family)
MRDFRFIALTPMGMADLSIPIAASRAAEIGVLDLQYSRDVCASLASLAKLARYAGRECGVKLDGRDVSFVNRVTSELPEQIKLVILTPAEPDSLRQTVQDFRQRGLTVLLETTCLEEARLGEAAGVCGLIAKGHEAGGRVGEETTFILLQHLLSHTSLPVWAHGGIGLHTAAACYVAGAAGVVLDAQLALTRESPLPENVKAAVARMDGSETICLGANPGEAYRLYSRPGLNVVEELRRTADTLGGRDPAAPENLDAWRREVKGRVGWTDAKREVWLLGQDAAFAAPLAERFKTVGGVLEGLRQAVETHVDSALALKPLGEHSPLARSHGTRYPIVQGPMTRVSDRAAFAAAVAEGGGLPFLALALMRAPEVRELLEETRRVLNGRPWGVGILGFVPFDLRQEQMDVIRAYRPSFALIAGGRPDQALSLEGAGIPTYLHVPSPGLLKLFVESKARRFVFEGRECGGHVGPRSSFVLWNTMIEALLEALPASEAEDCHVLFAGGIHDAVSASMVAAMAAPLAERGVRVGVLLGTAYLFTREAVETGAIKEGFQREAVRCKQTVLLETGPGHATRCAESPFVRTFRQEKQRLSADGRSAEEVRETLERLNLGRLRIASKGIGRNPSHGREADSQKFTELSADEQLSQGMYMIGQVAALRDAACTIDELHHEVSVVGTERLGEAPRPALSAAGVSARAEAKPCDIAIIGMACLLPKAPDLQTYWENILNKVDAITEVPKERWDWEQYFDPDPKTRDKIYSKWGGFLEDVPFDPLLYGMPPNTLRSIEPLQLLTLEVVRAALEDAGYTDRPFPRQRTSVILGVGGGISDLGQQYALRSGLPMFLGDVSPDVLARLPEWTEDSFAGILLNVAAGRVANRFDLGGVNYTVDAACASSLAAVYLAARELETGTSDMVIVGGADTVQNPFGYLCFSKTTALSPRGRCRTFDESADGIVISEGVAVLVMKRLADAERSGDRIYAVLKSVAGSSDGKDKGLTAPRPEGQALALERAYAKAGFSPATVGLVEAHGTGTVAGDRAEIETLRRVFEAAGAERQRCAIGSVKSLIGHTKCTAAVAGMVKTVLALHHKILPPTIHVEKPNPKARFSDSPFYVNTEPRPWVNGSPERPRRACVSAFGFGGTNFHAVLEEYEGDFEGPAHAAAARHWPAELLLWEGNSAREILSAVEALEQAMSRGARPELCDLAYTLWREAKGEGEARLAIVASSLDDLRQKLAWARQALETPGQTQVKDPRGIYFAERPPVRDGKVAFLFPGQGSQSPDMLRDLSNHFAEVREQFELADRTLAGRLPEPLSSYVYPPPSFSPGERQERQQSLTRTNVAQPALGAAGMGLFHLLQTLGVRPDFVAGHSYGEYVALCCAGVFGEETLYTLSEARGRCIIEAASDDLGTMAAVMEGAERVSDILKPTEGVWIGNLNAPRQTVISGTRAGIEQAIERIKAEGIQVRAVQVACAFHSPLVAPARDRLARVLSTVEFSAPRIDVYSNAHAAPYPKEPEAIAALLAEQLVSPVRFTQEVEAMYRAGARVFVEVGPHNVLTNLTQQIIGARPHLAVASDVNGRCGLTQLQHTLAQLACHGLPLNLERLYRGRATRRLNLAALEEETREKPLPPTTWLVNGGRARPLHEAAAPERADEHRAPAIVSDAAAHAPSPLHASNGRAVTSSSASASNGKTPAEASTAAANYVAPTPAYADPVNAALSHSNGDAGEVMLQFQRLMNRFLETQQQVMLAYLGASAQGSTAEPPAVTTHAAQNGGSATHAESSDVPRLTKAEALHPEASEVSLTAAPSTSAGVAAVEESASLFDEEGITQTLLRIVSERTGYSPDMLDTGLDIEADLGIDSIKRVEILGAFQRACPPSEQQKIQAAMERLTGLKTLRGIVDSVGALINQASATAAPSPDPESESSLGDAGAERGPVAAAAEDAEPPRFLLEAAEAALPVPSASTALDGLFVLTDDERGVAASLAGLLRARGARVVRLRAGDETVSSDSDEDTYNAKLTDPTALTELLEQIRVRHGGPITGVVHLLPLRPKPEFEQMDFAAWSEHLRLEVKSLFHLAKATSADFKQAGAAGRGRFVAATALGGDFANVASGRDFFPGHGGITGLMKTLAAEWPHAQCGVIDFAPEALPASSAERIMSEIEGGFENVEVGYRGARRLVIRPRLAPLRPDVPESFELTQDDVVLVVGGARGITAEAACELAERYRPTLLLVGRSPMPESEESAGTAGLTSVRELKSALIEQLRRAGQEATPTLVEAAYSRLLRDREMRRSLATMRRAGAKVSYRQVDVRDERAFGALIDEVYESHGRLDGVVYGAGIIEDKLIEDKLTESFDRVFDTKAAGAFILSRKLRPQSLKFLVLFSSVSGCFGNRGQGDYAAANETLNKLAVYLDRRWPGRVAAINWGPWDKAGMVSAEVRQQFESRGVKLITPCAGRAAFDQELRRGRKGEAEVVIGGGPWGAAESATDAASTDSYPLLDGVPLAVGQGGSVEAVYRLDPSRHLYLSDHRLDAKMVLPATFAMELMAEAVQKGWPEWEVVGVRALRVLKGIVVGEDPKALRIAARAQTQPSQEGFELDVDVEIGEPDRSSLSYYRATVQLAQRLPEPPLFEPPRMSGMRSSPLNAKEVYGRWLFHGPRFHCIKEIEGIADGGIVATVAPSSPRSCMDDSARGRWLIDPVVADSGPQLAILWARANSDMTALPSTFQSYRRFGSLSDSTQRCYFEVLAGSNGHVLRANVYFVNAEGRLSGMFEGLEATCSKALNRLTGATAGR